MFKKLNRQSIRLKGYDYSKEGLYFVTICCQDICRFGKIISGDMIINEMGKIAERCWLQIPEHFPNVVLHELVIMPNHIHGIIEIVGANHYLPKILAKDISPLPSGTSKTIGSIVRGFKIGVTKWTRQNDMAQHIWQRNYYENIIRNEKSYDNIARYIQNNPANWGKDKFHY